MTTIEWTDVTWNPTRGCRRVSPGCENCYAERSAIRQSNAGGKVIGNGVAPQRMTKPGKYHGLVVNNGHGPRWTGVSAFDPVKLAEPLSWKAPQCVFVDSMSDLFYEGFSFEQIAAVFGVMWACPQHTFQILTKRPGRALAFFAWLGHATGMNLADNQPVTMATDPLTSCQIQAGKHVNLGPYKLGERPSAWTLPNVWIGVSVEDQQRADERVPLLQQIPAVVHFLSMEPLLSNVELDADWLLPRCKACGRHSPRGKCCEYEPDCTGGTVHSNQQQPALVDWVIVGGESGPRARVCDAAWINDIVLQCKAAGVACFVKQLGSNAHSYGLPLPLEHPKGGDMSEWHPSLQVRQMPEDA